MKILNFNFMFSIGISFNSSSYTYKNSNFFPKSKRNKFQLKQKNNPKIYEKPNFLASKNVLTKANYIIIYLLIIILIPIIKGYKISFLSNDSYIKFKTKSSTNIKLFSHDNKNECKELTLPDIIEFDGINYSDISFYYEINQTINKVIKLIWKDDNKPKDAACLFQGCSDITEIDLSNFDSSEITSMFRMFNGCKSLISLNLSNLNTSKVRIMGSMFSSCESIESLDLSEFDTSNVIYMYTMFNNCNKLKSLNLSNFKTENVSHMHFMFSNCLSLNYLEISNFNMINVENIENILYNCKNLVYINLKSAKISINSVTKDIFNHTNNNLVVCSENEEWGNLLSDKTSIINCMSTNTISFKCYKKSINNVYYNNICEFCGLNYISEVYNKTIDTN